MRMCPFAYLEPNRRRCGSSLMSTIESKSVCITIRYALSEKYRKKRFKETGERPDRKQELEVYAKDLSEAVRKKLYDVGDLASIRSSDEVSKTFPLSVPEIKTKHNKRVNKIRASSPRLSNYPKFYVPSSTSVNPTLMEIDGPLTTDMLGEVLSRREQIWEEKRAEYAEDLDEAASRLLSLLEENSGHIPDGEGELKAPLVLRGNVLSHFEESDLYDNLKDAQEEAKSTREAYEAEKERRKKKRRRKKRNRREQRKTERREWAETHGSEVLKDALEEGYDCQRRYVKERVQAEFDENFRVDFDSEASCSGRSCPSEEALRFAQEVGGKVVWLTRPPKEDPGDGYREIAGSFEEQEAVRKKIRISEHGQRYDLFRTFE